MSVLSHSLPLYFLLVCIQLPAHNVCLFTLLSPFAYSTANTLLEFPLLCENIPSLALVFLFLWFSVPVSTAWSSLISPQRSAKSICHLL